MSENKKPTPTRDELNAALDWIESHKKRSYAHIVVLIMMAACCAPIAGIWLAHVGLGSFLSLTQISTGFFLAVSAALVIF